jgi:hypothetical protein
VLEADIPRSCVTARAGAKSREVGPRRPSIELAGDLEPSAGDQRRLLVAPQRSTRCGRGAPRARDPTA